VTDVGRMEADVAIQIVRPTNLDLKVVKLGRFHIYPFAAPKYLETFGTPQSKADLARHRIIDQVSPQIAEGFLEKLIGLESIEGVVAVRTNASSAHFYAIEQGIGIGVLPTYAIPLGADVVPLDLGIRQEVDIWLTYHPDVREVPRVSLFIDWLRDIFDPAKYPWFRDEFIHPNELIGWQPKRPGATIEPARGVIAHPPRLDELAA
jgi:DNA-binding transcriptional LysR family regulator